MYRVHSTNMVHNKDRVHSIIFTTQGRRDRVDRVFNASTLHGRDKIHSMDRGHIMDGCSARTRTPKKRILNTDRLNNAYRTHSEERLQNTQQNTTQKDWENKA